MKKVCRKCSQVAEFQPILTLRPKESVNKTLPIYSLVDEYYCFTHAGTSHDELLDELLSAERCAKLQKGCEYLGLGNPDIAMTTLTFRRVTVNPTGSRHL